MSTPLGATSKQSKQSKKTGTILCLFFCLFGNLIVANELFGVYPFTQNGVQHHHSRSYCPGNRVEHIYSLYCAYSRQSQLNPKDSEYAHRYEHYYHRRHCFACASYRSCQAVQYSQHKIERTKIFHCVCTVGDYRRVGRKKPDDLVRECKQQGTCYYRVQRYQRVIHMPFFTLSIFPAP